MYSKIWYACYRRVYILHKIQISARYEYAWYHYMYLVSNTWSRLPTLLTAFILSQLYSAFGDGAFGGGAITPSQVK